MFFNKITLLSGKIKYFFILFCFSYRTEQFHLLFYGCFDRLSTWCKKLSWVKSLALQILAFFDILTCSFRKCDLALSIYIDLGNA